MNTSWTRRVHSSLEALLQAPVLIEVNTGYSRFVVLYQILTTYSILCCFSDTAPADWFLQHTRRKHVESESEARNYNACRFRVQGSLPRPVTVRIFAGSFLAAIASSEGGEWCEDVDLQDLGSMDRRLLLAIDTASREPEGNVWGRVTEGAEKERFTIDDGDVSGVADASKRVVGGLHVVFHAWSAVVLAPHVYNGLKEAVWSARQTYAALLAELNMESPEVSALLSRHCSAVFQFQSNSFVFLKKTQKLRRQYLI